MACFASFCGGLLSCLSLYFFSPILAQLAMKFKSPEYFWLSLFGLTIIAGVSSRSILKGLMSGVFGLLLSTVGMDPMEGVPLSLIHILVATLSSGAMCKGLAAAFVGLFLSTVGIDPVSGDFRNTFEVPELFNGISLVPALVGLFAVSQVLLSLEDVFLGKGGIVKEGKL